MPARYTPCGLRRGPVDLYLRISILQKSFDIAGGPRPAGSQGPERGPAPGTRADTAWKGYRYPGCLQRGDTRVPPPPACPPAGMPPPAAMERGSPAFHTPAPDPILGLRAADRWRVGPPPHAPGDCKRT